MPKAMNKRGSCSQTKVSKTDNKLIEIVKFDFFMRAHWKRPAQVTVIRHNAEYRLIPFLLLAVFPCDL